MKWQIKSESETKRVSTKKVNNVEVERIEVYGLHHASIFGKNVIGTYARPRWKVRGFKALGDFFTTFGDLKEFLNDPDAVAATINLAKK